MALEEPKPKTQKARILELFHNKQTWSNFELRALDPPCFQYPVRIKELIEEGHNIEGWHDPHDRRKYFYTLHLKNDLFEIR